MAVILDPNADKDGGLDESTAISNGNHVSNFLDADVKSSNYVQVARYTPRCNPLLTTSQAKEYLPYDVWLITPTSHRSISSRDEKFKRDYYEYVTKYRTQGVERHYEEDMNRPRRWGSLTPILWSETRLHLQKAWIATSSEMVAGATGNIDETANVESSRKYALADARDTWFHNENTWQDSVAPYKGLLFGQYSTALQYHQSYTAKLSAYNYGDRTVDGVEFTYIMPRGAEPQLDASGNVQVSASVLSGVSGPAGYVGDPKLNESYAAIPANEVEVEVLQRPDGPYAGYDAPSASQNPADYRNGMSLKAGAIDRSVDPALSSYENKPSAGGMNSESYLESSQPWVLRITVRHPLGKWFGRSSDGTAVGADKNVVDPDIYTGNAGYKMSVAIKARIFGYNENEAWYDRLLTRPINTREVSGHDVAAGQTPSLSDAYFQVFDIDRFRGKDCCCRYEQKRWRHQQCEPVWHGLPLCAACGQRHGGQ